MSQALLQTLTRRFGLAPGVVGDAFAAALQGLAQRHGLEAPQVAEQALWNAQLLRELAGRLAVHESYFFRHPDAFDALADLVERRLATQPQLTLWSVGCCTGEEPYSLAVVLEERLGPGWSSRVGLRACDVSAQALATAEAGVYGEWSFRDAVTPARRAAAFEPHGRGRWRLKESLRSAVRFEHLSAQELVAQLAPGSVDALLFRNVAVYFEPDAAEALYEAMAGVLAEGGLLCLAATDPQPRTALLSRADAVSLYRRADSLPRPDRSRPRAVAKLAPPNARALADAGRIDEALRALDGPGHGLEAAERELLRGQICLSAGRPLDARAALDRLLALAPAHRLGRYWRALALAGAGQGDAALVDLRELARQLEVAGSAPLEDGHSTAAELRAALSELEARLS